MPLPDVSRFPSLAPELLRALASRVHAIGIDAQSVGAIARIGDGFPGPMGAPLRVWHARRRQDVVAYAIRLFFIHDAITKDEARAVLGEGIALESLVSAGLLVARSDGGMECPFQLNMAGSLLVFCDVLAHAGEAVMGASSATTVLCAAGRPTAHVKRALDVGCGAGTAALLFAAACDVVIGTDINPRAMTFARMNAQLNAIANVEFREGDLFAPVAGETFDLIVSQPPFVPRIEGAEQATYLHGGERGDEVPMRLLREASRHLAPGGRAVVLVEWPLEEGQRVETRVREAVPQDDVSVLVVQAPAMDLDDHCMLYAAPSDYAEFARVVVAWRAHYERTHVKELRLAVTILSKVEAPFGWTSTAESPRFAGVPAKSARIDLMIAARDLTARGPDALLNARVRIVPGVTFTLDRAVKEGSEALMLVRFPEDALVEPTAVNEPTHRLYALASSLSSVRDAVSHIAAASRKPFGETASKVLPAISHGLLYGMLCVAPR